MSVVSLFKHSSFLFLTTLNLCDIHVIYPFKLNEYYLFC